MANVGTLAVKLVLGDRGFAAGLDAATRRAQAFGARLGVALTSPVTIASKLTNTLVAPISGFAGALGDALRGIPLVGGLLATLPLSVGGFSSAIVSEMGRIVEIQKQAQQLGVSTQLWSSISSLMDAEESEGLHKSLQNLAEMLGLIQSGAKGAGAGLALIGMQAQDVADLSVEEALLRIADGIQSLGTHAQRVAATTAIFGGRADDLVGFFARGSAGIRDMMVRADQLGLSFNAFDAAKVQLAQRSMGRIAASIQGIIRQLAIELAPLIEFVAEKFQEWIGSGGGIRESIGAAIEFVIEALTRLTELIDSVLNQLLDTIHEEISNLITDMLPRMPQSVVGGAVALAPALALPLAMWNDQAGGEPARQRARVNTSGVLRDSIEALRNIRLDAGIRAAGAALANAPGQPNEAAARVARIRELGEAWDRLTGNIKTSLDAFAEGVKTAFDAKKMLKADDKDVAKVLGNLAGEFLKDEVSGDQTFGAAVEGSKEALSAIARWQRQGIADPIQRIQDKIDRMIEQQKRQEDLGKQIRDAIKEGRLKLNNVKF